MIEIKLKACTELPPLGADCLQKRSNIVIGYGHEAVRRCYLSGPIYCLDRQVILFTQGLGNEPKAFYFQEDSCLYIGYDSHLIRVNPFDGRVSDRLDGTVFYDVVFAKNGTKVGVIFETEVMIADNQLSIKERKSFDVIEEYQFDGVNLSVIDIEGKCVSFQLEG